MGTFTKSVLPTLTRGTLIGAIKEVPDFDHIGISSACNEMQLEIYSKSQGKRRWNLQGMYQDQREASIFKVELEAYFEQHIITREGIIKALGR